MVVLTEILSFLCIHSDTRQNSAFYGF